MMKILPWVLGAVALVGGFFLVRRFMVAGPAVVAGAPPDQQAPSVVTVGVSEADVAAAEAAAIIAREQTTQEAISAAAGLLSAGAGAVFDWLQSEDQTASTSAVWV